jgi:hypothetical protein
MERNYHSVFSSVINYLNVSPFLYRYENQEFIDRFFETGEILISCFNQYSKYEDNQLGDKSEGFAHNFGNMSNGLTVSTVTTIGMNAYCFCASTILDSELFKTFKRNSVFRINDPINFILQIEKSLNRVFEVLYGNCIYLENKMLIKEIPAFNMDDLKVENESNNISFDKLMAATSPLNGPEQFFLKKMIYQKQSEYRIIWNTDREVKTPVIIKCPEAIKYCEKIESKVSSTIKTI